jgi:hypothetical protein
VSQDEENVKSEEQKYPVQTMKDIFDQFAEDAEYEIDFQRMQLPDGGAMFTPANLDGMYMSECYVCI